MGTNWYLGTIILGFCCIVIELLLGVATGFDLFLIGLILIVSGVVGHITQSLYVLFGTASALSLMYVFIFRMMIRSKFEIATKHTNTDALIGKKAVVVKRISPHMQGQIKVEGEIWRAESTDIHEVGSEVTVCSVSGVTLSV